MTNTQESLVFTNENCIGAISVLVFAAVRAHACLK